MNRSLVRLGFLLFLLALITGFAIPELRIPQLGVSAHLIATMGGIALIAVGLVWPSLRLQDGAKRLLVWMWIVAVYGNWVVTLLSGVLGGSHFMPIASGGSAATPVQDMLLSGTIVIVSLDAVLATILVLWGLRGRDADEN